MAKRGRKRRPRYNKKNLAKVIGGALALLIVAVLLVVQVYVTGNRRSIRTQIAMSDSAVRSVSAEMLIVRDERYLTAKGGGSTVSAVENGERVSANQVVAYTFSDSNAAANLSRMREVRKDLDYFESLLGKSSTVVSDTAVYDSRILNAVYDYAEAVDSAALGFADARAQELRNAITSRQTATGVQLDLTGTINALREEYTKLQTATSGYTTIETPVSGYYISGADGFENVVAYDTIDSMSIEDAETAIAAPAAAVPAGVAGKIVHGYYWYMLCVLPMEQMGELSVGERKTVSFPNASVGSVKAEVYRVTADADAGKVLIVFRCDIMNEDVTLLRHEAANIYAEEYNGYRVENTAIRVNENNETGVYVLKGRVIWFKKIKIEYSYDDYSIVSAPEKGSEDAISLYDEYVIEGKDLYDGKLIYRS